MIPILSVSLLSLSLVAGTQGMLTGSFDIPVGDYRYVLFGLNEPQKDSARVEGTIGVSPDTLELEVLLFHVDDFNRWVSDQGNVDTLFVARVRSGPLTVPVPGFGDFVMVMSNRGNWQAAHVDAALELSYAGSGAGQNQLVDASKIVLVMMGAAALVTVFAAAVITERKRRSRMRRRAAAGKVDSRPPEA